MYDSAVIFGTFNNKNHSHLCTLAGARVPGEAGLVKPFLHKKALQSQGFSGRAIYPLIPKIC